VATPTTNFVLSSTFDPSLTGSGIYVAKGYIWGTFGSGVTLTYSFPTGTAFSDPNYDGNEWSSWSPTTTAERAAIRSALATWSHFADVDFVETSDNASNVGELRFAYSNTLGMDEAAHAYLPFSYPAAGDVWFNPRFFNGTGGGIPAGSFDFLTILHEVGHALGLKHSFAAPALPASKDNLLFSIMSYTASPWSAHGDNYASFYPTTPMYYDLIAIEAMYGQRAYNTGSNTYSFVAGHKYWQAIHDTGGTDTIRYIGTLASTINLNPGALSSLSDPIAFHRPNGSTTYSRSTVTIGPDVVIENASGGAGNDLLVGNGVRNGLNGVAGNDTIRGLGGDDYLRGGIGNDRLTGGVGNDFFVFNTKPNPISNHDTVIDFTVGQDAVLLENGIFTQLRSTGPLSDYCFQRGSHAGDGNDFIVYYRANGNLFYDSNGSGAGQQVLIATLTNRPDLHASDFLVI
jgi:Ca2+-binding RTX toxin-like protein